MKIKVDMDIELHNMGYVINHKTFLKLVKQLGVQCFVRIKKYESYKANQKWVTDATEFF